MLASAPCIGALVEQCSGLYEDARRKAKIFKGVASAHCQAGGIEVQLPRKVRVLYLCLFII